MEVQVRKENGAINYMPQLDGLRVFAVGAVLIHHYLPGDFILNKINIGHLGVRLFFVLSGFLITRILLNCRRLVETNSASTSSTIKSFFLRRFLRLTPVYYLALLITTLFAFNTVKPALPYLLTYTSNIYFSFHPWDDVASHFWSLAVEEQFYLIWPWVIVLLPKKYLLKAIVFTISLGPLFRLLSSIAGWNNWRLEYSLTPACLDSLGMGAVLACLYFYNLKSSRQLLCKLGLWIGLPGILLTHSVTFGKYPALVVLENLINALFFVWLVDKASNGFSGIIGRILEHPWLIYLGKISYGIYVYHLFIAPYLLEAILSYLGFSIESIWLKAFLYSIATIGVASLSWQFLEKPVNQLKKHFKYKTKTT